MEKLFITPQQAIDLLNDSKYIHPFRNTGNILIGADWKIKEVKKII